MRFKSFKPAAESGGRNSIVDKLGYIPAERRIRGLLQSGVRFAAAGADMYDGFIEDGALVIPPWRSKDFDIAEGSQFLRNAVKRRDEVLRNAALAKKSDASEVDQVPEQSQTAQEGAGASVPAGGRGAAPRVPQAPPEGQERRMANPSEAARTASQHRGRSPRCAACVALFSVYFTPLHTTRVFSRLFPLKSEGFGELLHQPEPCYGQCQVTPFWRWNMGWISNAMRSVSDVPNGGSVDPISLSVAGGLGAANLIGNLVGQSAAAKASREANDFNKWAYEVAMGREDTAVQRRVADLKAAGLSPTLAAGSAAQSMGPISIGANQSVDPSAAIGAGLQGVLATSQVAQTRAQTDLIKEQARATEYGMLSQHFRDKIQEYMLPAEMRNKIASTSKYYADIASLGATTKLNNQTFDRSDSTGQRPGSFFSDFGLGYEKFKSDIGAKDGFLGDHGRVDSKVKKGAKEALRGG